MTQAISAWYTPNQEGTYGRWDDGAWVLIEDGDYPFATNTADGSVEIFDQRTASCIASFWDDTFELGSRGTVTFEKGIPSFCFDQLETMTVRPRAEPTVVVPQSESGPLVYALASDGCYYARQGQRYIKLETDDFRFVFRDGMAYLTDSGGRDAGAIDASTWGLENDEAGTVVVTDGAIAEWEITPKSKEKYGTDDDSSEDDSTADRSDAGSDTKADRHIPLVDGTYSFRYRDGRADVYNSEGRQCATVSVDTRYFQDGDEGYFGVAEATMAPFEDWVINGQADSRKPPAQAGEPDKYASLPALAKSLDQHWDVFRQSNDVWLQKLWDPDGVFWVPFVATTKWLILGSVDGDLKTYLDQIAIQGELRFVRYRTRPNVFSFVNVNYPSVPLDFPDRYTGSGGLSALGKAERMLKEMVAASNTYPYRDRNRVRVEWDAEANSVAAQDAKDESVRVARADQEAARVAKRLAATPASFEGMKGSQEWWNRYLEYCDTFALTENIRFWRAVAQYRANPGFALYGEICNMFIGADAEWALNLPSSIVVNIRKAGNGPGNDAGRDVFNAALADVLATLKDQFEAFRQWYASQPGDA